MRHTFSGIWLDSQQHLSQSGANGQKAHKTFKKDPYFSWYIFLSALGIAYLMSSIILTDSYAELDAAAQRIAFFKVLRSASPRQFATLLEQCSLHQVAANEQVIQQGQNDKRLFFIVSGSVEVSANGRYLATLPAGDTFGEIAMLTDSTRTASVKASPGNSAATVLLSFNAGIFGALRDFRVVSLQSKLVFYRLLIQRARWRLEKNRIRYPQHPFFLRLPHLQEVAANDDDIELEALHERAFFLTQTLIAWNALGMDIERDSTG